MDGFLRANICRNGPKAFQRHLQIAIESAGTRLRKGARIRLDALADAGAIR
jgi:hypothetical protein